MPGAGHFLVFNNNQYLFQRTPQSYAFEINPYLDAGGRETGAYVAPPSAGYTTWTFDKDTHKSSQLLSRQVVWKYSSISNLVLFSPFGSSVQRLPNGNTLICATATGYLVEVTAAGDIAWEFVNPVTAGGAMAALGDRLPLTNAVPRAYRYGADYAGLAGRTLTAGRYLKDYGTFATTATPARLANLSTRAAVGGAAGTPIPGFTLSGAGTRTMLVRAAGPTLASFGVGGALADPKVSLVSGSTTVATNDNWLAADATAMTAAGAFALLAASKDAALLTNLPAGVYSAPVTAADNVGTGVALLEVYATGAATTPALGNASTRAYVGTGDAVLIVGFVVDGPGTVRLLLRAVGPGLTAYGVSGALADPALTLYRGTTPLQSNDDWMAGLGAPDVITVGRALGAFPLAAESKDAALVVTLPAGVYSAVVRGAGDTTGTALVEIYVAP